MCKPIDKIRIARAVREILTAIGENPNRDGLIETPGRVARFYEEWATDNGYNKYTAFYEKYNSMVILNGIPFFSLCEHHILPFQGRAWIGYIPNKKVLGLSKFVRILRKHSSRLQIQERIARGIADDLEKEVKPKGIMIVLEAEHSCMSLRGVRTPGVFTTTSEIRGAFEKQEVRLEFLTLMKK